MLAAFVREHWRAYAAAGGMLSCIAAMTVWIPRQVGHVVDDLVVGGLPGRPCCGNWACWWEPVCSSTCCAWAGG